ncbi:hypothetical protein [Aquimarina sp. 2201CG14-23]|uniref:hypothetical protein n=1 Tax=Aquimarina mycalae TaxID=3040073 RepID=UPI002477F03B|nr:hypothetical protein [Aquimarina sp. 2201CG14-23]MDH7447825.1 hypothetical protein [Aquimarina sp. 2201CG14-23]
MKNLIYILNFIIIISVLSCGQNSFEKELNGKWYGIEDNGITRMHFYPDSLILTADPYEKVTWKANKSKIEFDYPFLIWDSLGSPNRIQDKITIHYKLSKDKDTLFGVFVNQFGENKLNLLRTKNYLEYINKRYAVELPIDNSVELIKTKGKYGLKVFMTNSDNKIIGRTELSENLNYIESDIIKFKDSIKPNGRTEIDGHDKFYDRRFHIRVFADKKISDSIITQYLSVTVKHEISEKNAYLRKPPNDTLPIKIYRIYQSEETENLGDLKGKEIKTIANNIYVITAD